MDYFFFLAAFFAFFFVAICETSSRDLVPKPRSQAGRYKQYPLPYCY